MTICSGFMLCPSSGVNSVRIVGLTASFTKPIPVSTSGVFMSMISSGMVCARGARLTALSKENGTTSRTATSAHRKHEIHFGAFFSKKRTSTAAAIRNDAEMLRFRIFRKIALIYLPSLNRSIILWISSISFSLSVRLSAKAAIKAGSEPWKESATTCPLFSA